MKDNKRQNYYNYLYTSNRVFHRIVCSCIMVINYFGCSIRSSRSQSQHGEVNVVRIVVHVLLDGTNGTLHNKIRDTYTYDDLQSHLEESVSYRSMANGSRLAAIQFKDLALLFDKDHKVKLDRVIQRRSRSRAFSGNFIMSLKKRQGSG